MRNRRNYYRILHVQPDAPPAVIKSSYRTLMQKLRIHPDLGGDNFSASLLNEAYQMLSDPASRLEYDQEYYPRFSRSKAEQSSTAKQHAPGQKRARDHQVFEEGCNFCGAQNPYPFVDTPETRCVQCYSPLTMPERQDMSASGTRAINRIPQCGSITFFTGYKHDGIHGEITDMSLEGMRFISGINLITNQILKIEAETVEAIARVASCERTKADTHESFAIGVEFLTVIFVGPRGVFVSEKA